MSLFKGKTIFPSPGSTLVKALSEEVLSLQSRYPALKGFHVSTARSMPTKASIKKEIIVQPVGGAITQDGLFRVTSFNVFIFAPDESMVDGAALIIEAILTDLKSEEDSLMRTEIVVPVRDYPVEGNEYARTLIFQAHFLGKPFQKN